VTVSYLLDTCILSEPLRPRPDPAILARLARHDGQCAIASVTWNELWFGCARLPDSARRRAIEDYLEQVVAPGLPVLPYDESAARWHGEERARLSTRGTPPPFVDGMIAAIARTRHLVLVTRNTADFACFEGLTCTDWRD